MLQFEDFVDILSAVAVIIVISVFITLAWMSTYVRDQPLVATAVVVFQQESTTPSTASIPAMNTNTCGSSSGNLNDQNIQGESSNNMSTPQEAGSDQTPQNSEEEKVLPEERELEGDEKCEDSPQSSRSSGSDSNGNNIEKTTSMEEASDSKTGNHLTPVGKVKSSSHLKPKPIPEGDDSESSSSHLRYTTNQESESTPSVSNNTVHNQTYEAEAEVQYENLLEESIRIKLKFLDDTQRLVRGQLTDEVGSFKRANFNPELASNCVVRLIFNGQLLNRDNSTLGQYGLFDNCVVHCHISQPQPVNASETNSTTINHESDGLDLSEILNPLLLVVVAFLWYLRYEYSHIFDTSATVILAILTALLLLSQYAFTISFNISWSERGNNSNNNNPQPRNEVQPRILPTPIIASSTSSLGGDPSEVASSSSGNSSASDGGTRSREDSSSKYDISFLPQDPPVSEGSITVNPVSSSEPILLNS